MKSLLVKDMVMYRLSNFIQTPAAEVSLATSLTTLSLKQRMMVLWAFSRRVSLASAERDAGSQSSPPRGAARPCCTRRAFILILHIPKLFFPLNFSVSNLAAAIDELIEGLLLLLQDFDSTVLLDLGICF